MALKYSESDFKKKKKKTGIVTGFWTDLSTVLMKLWLTQWFQYKFFLIMSYFCFTPPFHKQENLCVHVVEKQVLSRRPQEE